MDFWADQNRRVYYTVVRNKFAQYGEETVRWVESYLTAFEHLNNLHPDNKTTQKRYLAAKDMHCEPLLRWLRWIEANGERIPWCGEVVGLAVAMKLGVKP
jgi:hypothetical protein